MNDSGLPPAFYPPDPPWRWRDCRDIQVSLHLHLSPVSWRFRAWWDPESDTLAAGLHAWFVSIQLWCDTGDRSDRGWRGRLSRSGFDGGDDA